MADMHDAQHWAEQDSKSILTKFTNLTGAILSLALIAGIGTWGYKTIMRDVSGVPVVRAAKEPMRVAPEDPGGRAAAHQGLAVNVIAAEGTSAPPPDRLVLAPPPLELSVEDAATAPAPGRAVAPRAAPTAGGRRHDDASLTENLHRVSMLALADEIVAETAPLTASQPEAEMSEEPEAATSEPAGGLGQSLRPRPRPARLASLPDIVAASVAAASAPIDVAPETIEPGTRLAQLGAFESPEVARAEWTTIAGRFGDFIDGKQRVIQRAESGGRIFYRLRAKGFDDLGDARRFCSALVAEGADCIPVIAR